MSCVEPEPVHVVLVHPVEGVAYEEVAHMPVREVEGVAPRRLFFGVGGQRTEICLAEIAEVVAVRAKMVIYHVLNDGQPFIVRRVYQLLQSGRPAIGARGGVEADAIVTPVAAAREVGNRHQLDCRHAQCLEVWQLADNRFEGALWREGAHV